MILALTREYGWGDPSAFDALDPDVRVSIIADWMVRHDPPKKRGARG
jgi:hypothetical protein